MSLTTESKYTLHPAHPSHSPTLAESMILSRLTDPHWAFLFLPSTTPSTIISSTTSRLPHTLSTSRDVRRHEVVLTTADIQSTPGNENGDHDGRERVVGYARWTLPPSLADRDDVWLSAQVAEASAQEKEEYKRMGDPLEKVEERVLRDVVGGEEVLTLEYLTTHPDYWRQGVGSMLVQSGVRVADQYGMKTYVMSEPAGLKVYLNHGFKVVDEITVEYAQFGGTEPTTHYFLVREPVPLN
ncbi:FAD binding domain family protein [Aspergillus niger]|uniref:FAD binding domain family protein n=1 Tax=Aspergillus niger TaxID=5061 RepID=A0A505HK00_ASPNG|nr:FAD binding domain family protein [Aspergillus niger]